MLQCVDEASADRLFDQLRLSLGPAGPPTICIKPAHDSNGLGVVRATCGQDLQIYAQVRRFSGVLALGEMREGWNKKAPFSWWPTCWGLYPADLAECLFHRADCPWLCVQAVEQWVAVIPGGMLSSGGDDVAMPMPPPSQFVVEPFVTTEPMQVCWGGRAGLGRAGRGRARASLTL